MKYHVLGSWRAAGAGLVLSPLAALWAAALLASLLAGCGAQRATGRLGDPPRGSIASREHDAEAREAEAAARAAEKEALAIERMLELAKAKAELQEAENKLRLGREAAKASLATAASRVGKLGYATGAACVLTLIIGSFFGGVGRKTALSGLLISGGCVFVQYFILVYGVVVSETVSWAIIVGLAAGAVFAAAWAGRYLWMLWNAKGVAAKRARDGDDGRDAIALLPVARKVKSQLHAAWDYLRDPSPGDALSEAQAADLLKRFGLPLPVPAGGPAAGAGAGAAEVKGIGGSS